MKLILLVFFYISIQYQELLGQKVYSSMQVSNIARKEGLLELTNEFIHKDKYGFVWISSMEGLNRFDGRRIKLYKPNLNDPYALINGNIQSPFFENREGDIWFTVTNAIHVYRRQKDNFDVFSVKQNGNTTKSGAHTALCLEQNRWLWVQASDSLFRFDTKAPPQYEKDNAEFLHKLQAARFAVDTYPNGQIRRVVACYWAYQKGVEVLDYDINHHLKSRKTYFTGEKNSKQPPLTIKKAIIENDTLIWLSSIDGLVALNPEKPALFQLFSFKKEGVTLQNIGILPNRQIFISTSDAAFQSVDIVNKQFTPLSIQSQKGEKVDKIMPNGAQAVYLDKSNNLWLSAYKQGVFFSKAQFAIFNNIDLKGSPPIDIEHINESADGNIFINYAEKENKGVLLIPKEKPIYFNKLLKNSRFFKTNRGDLWNISRLGHIQIWDKIANQFKTLIIDTLLFNAVVNYQNNTFLIGTNKGIYQLDTDKKKYKPFGLKAYFITKFYKDAHDRLWIGTNDGKVLCFDNQFKAIKEIANLEVINFFYTSINTSSVVWVATAKGIVKINIETLTNTLITEKEGLLNDYIQSVLEDKNGNLWCSTSQGIFKYNTHTKHTKRYTKTQGLSSNIYNQSAALLSSTGEMWFGGTNGVDVFHPDSVRDIGSAPQSAIVGLKIFDDYWKGETAIEVAEKVKLKYFQNTLTLELAAMEYTDPENNRFKVALVQDGDSIKWVDLGTQNYITYPNLREGKYTFMLLTANTEGVWNKKPKTLAIEITPPFWRTWWFLILVVLSSIALVSYIVYLRLSKIIELQRIRLKLYENLHDDIGSRLTAIVLSVEQVIAKTSKKDPLWQQVSDISKSIVGNMRRLVWATAPENDALKNIMDKMREDRRLLLPEQVSFSIEMDKSLQTLTVAGDKRYQMLSVFNEALINISKYAEATQVHVKLHSENDMLSMTIQDNGKGFDPQKPREDKPNSSGYGLTNMQKRANRIKGSLKIISTEGRGTTIQFTFPLKEDSIWVKIRDYFSKNH